MELAHLEMEADLARWTQELGGEGRGCHRWLHSPPDSPPHHGHHPAPQEPAPGLSESKLGAALNALRLEQAWERRTLLLALGEREQFHSERLTRMERHQENQLGTVTLKLISLSHQLSKTASERRQPLHPHPQPWRSTSGRQPPQESSSYSSGARGPQPMSKEKKSRPDLEEATIETLDSPEERRTARRLRIAKRLDDTPALEREVGDMLRLRRTSLPDPDGQSDSRNEGTARLTAAATLPGSRIP